MPDNNMLLTILIGALIAGFLYYVFFGKNNSSKEAPESGNTKANPLQLQAYERLILLTDRIAIPNLISRTPCEGLSARDMQAILTKTIREEFDYNITQQIYITPEVWKAVKNLKEKNLLLINQVTSVIPADASALDLNRAILELIMTDSTGNMHELVSEALSYEAKKLL